MGTAAIRTSSAGPNEAEPGHAGVAGGVPTTREPTDRVGRPPIAPQAQRQHPGRVATPPTHVRFLPEQWVEHAIRCASDASRGAPARATGLARACASRWALFSSVPSRARTGTRSGWREGRKRQIVFGRPTRTRETPGWWCRQRGPERACLSEAADQPRRFLAFCPVWQGLAPPRPHVRARIRARWREALRNRSSKTISRPPLPTFDIPLFPCRYTASIPRQPPAATLPTTK